MGIAACANIILDPYYLENGIDIAKISLISSQAADGFVLLAIMILSGSTSFYALFPGGYVFPAEDIPPAALYCYVVSESPWIAEFCGGSARDGPALRVLRYGDAAGALDSGAGGCGCSVASGC